MSRNNVAIFRDAADKHPGSYTLEPFAVIVSANNVSSSSPPGGSMKIVDIDRNGVTASGANAGFGFNRQ
jgi:hypothetical protein